MHKGIGAVFAMVLAELLIVIALALLYYVGTRRERNGRQEGLYSTDSFLDCARYLGGGRWPQALVGVLKCLPFILGLALLGKTASNEDGMALDYGVFAGKYLVICGIVVCIISMAMLPVAARIYASLRREDNRFARSVFQSGMHICMVHGIFAASFLAFMGSWFAELFCGEEGETMRKMLQGGSCVVPFLALAAFFSLFLRSSGKKYPLLAAVGIADIVFAATVALTQGIGRVGVLSLVYGGITGSFVLCILLGALSGRQMRLQVDWLNVLIMPSGAAAAAGLLCMLLGKLISPHLGSLVTLIVTLILSLAIYWVALLIMRNFREQELEVMTGGRLIHMLGQILQVY